MTIPGHLAGGYLALKIATRMKPSASLNSLIPFVTGMLISLAPDFDALFFKTLREHHCTLLHTPFFGGGISLLISAIGILSHNTTIKTSAGALLIGSFTHLFLDWFAARTTGIRTLYPLSTKEYSLFPLNPEKGMIPVSLLPDIKYLRFYAQNLFLLVVELVVIVGAIAHGIVTKIHHV